jgi:hypothetical protein
VRNGASYEVGRRDGMHKTVCCSAQCGSLPPPRMENFYHRQEHLLSEFILLASQCLLGRRIYLVVNDIQHPRLLCCSEAYKDPINAHVAEYALQRARSLVQSKASNARLRFAASGVVGQKGQWPCSNTSIYKDVSLYIFHKT